MTKFSVEVDSGPRTKQSDFGDDLVPTDSFKFSGNIFETSYWIRRIHWVAALSSVEV